MLLRNYRLIASLEQRLDRLAIEEKKKLKLEEQKHEQKRQDQLKLEEQTRQDQLKLEEQKFKLELQRQRVAAEKKIKNLVQVRSDFISCSCFL
jgi:predicted secreted protein